MPPFIKIFIIGILTIIYSGAVPVIANAHELIPQALIEFIETYPEATAADITDFLTANPDVRGKSTASTEALVASVRADTSLGHTILDFIKLGITHVLSGLDHVLFVVVIILFATTLPTMIRLITSFTLAHSITLILAAVGFVTVPSSLVEPVIALSIVYLALTTLVCKNLAVNKNLQHGVLVIFIFGLFHGLGFAGIIQEVGIASARLLPALLSFNIGVEIAQLLIVAAMFPFIYLTQHQAWYPRLQQLLGIVITIVAMIWTLERIFGITIFYSLL